MIKRVLSILLFICLSGTTFAQLQALLDQYNLNGLAINPAYAGSTEALNVGLYSRNQWIGFEGAPKTLSFSAHTPLRNKKVNLGLIVMNDRLGSKTETGFILNYAYRIQMNKGKLSFGLAAGISSLSTDLNSIRYTDTGDQLLVDPGRRALLPEFSFGSYYYTDKYYVGVSMPLFSTHLLNEESGKYKVAFRPSMANYLIVAGYLFTLSDEFELLPSILFKTNPANATQLDVNCNLIYREKFWIGTSLRTNGNLSTLLQVQINPQIRIGYTYGYEISELSTYQKGSHEVMLLYNFRYILDVVSPRYF